MKDRLDDVAHLLRVLEHIKAENRTAEWSKIYNKYYLEWAFLAAQKAEKSK